MLRVVVRSSAIQHIEVIGNCVFDLEVSDCSNAGKLASSILRLPEREELIAIRVGVVISLGDSLNNIRLIADVTTNNPFATALALAVADVETGADDFIVRLDSKACR